MAQRNWCSVALDPTTEDLIFDLRVEAEQGLGKTVG